MTKQTFEPEPPAGEITEKPSNLAKYAKFEKRYKRARDRNYQIFDQRFALLQEKFGLLASKFLDHESFEFRENGQPRLPDEEFERIIDSLDEEKVKTILPYIKKGDLEKNYELRRLVFEYIFGPEIERKEIEESKISMEEYFGNIDIDKRKEFRDREPGLYYQYVIYRYLKFLKWKYKTESFEKLAGMLKKDKNERALFLTKEFLRIKDKLLGDDEIELAYLGKNRVLKMHEDWFSADGFREFKMSVNGLEKKILEEAETVKQTIRKVKKLGRNNTCIAVPNRRLAWIYEHLLPDWQDDPALFKNKEDKMLFKLDSALLSQEYGPRDQDIYLPLATVRIAQKWLEEEKINHFVYVFKGIKYASTPNVEDMRGTWSIGGRGFRGGIQKSDKFEEPSESIFQRVALEKIAEAFKGIPIVLIDINKSGYPGSFWKFTRNIPVEARRHLMGLTTGVFRDNVIELLGSDYWEALNYGHPNRGDKSNWHYLPKAEELKTTRGKMKVGKYYVEKIKEKIKEK